VDPTLPAVCAIFLVAAFVQAALGFGFALVAMSGLALTHDVMQAAGVVNIAGSLQIIAMSVALRHAIVWPYVRRVLPWAVLGVLAGVWILAALDHAVAVRLLGASIVGIVAWNLFGRTADGGRESTSRASAAATGLASGVLTGAFNQGGPPLIAHLYRRPYAPEALKGTAQFIFLVTGLLRLPVAAAHGQLTTATWWRAAIALPFVAVGMFAGLHAARRLDADRFRRVSWTALLLLGVYLVLHG